MTESKKEGDVSESQNVKKVNSEIKIPKKTEKTKEDVNLEQNKKAAPSNKKDELPKNEVEGNLEQNKKAAPSKKKDELQKNGGTNKKQKTLSQADLKPSPPSTETNNFLSTQKNKNSEKMKVEPLKKDVNKQPPKKIELTNLEKNEGTGKKKKITKTPQAAEPAEKIKKVSDTREESSNIIINYFKRISDDLRDIKNFLISQSRLSSIAEGSQLEDKEVSLNDEDAEQETKNIRKPTKVEFGDEYYLNKLKSKFENNPFTVKETRRIYIAGQGKISMEKWGPILERLCKNKLIVCVSEDEEMKQYKILY